MKDNKGSIRLVIEGKETSNRFASYKSGGHRVQTIDVMGYRRL